MALTRNALAPLAVATGDAAGIGPQVSVQAAVRFLRERPKLAVMLYGDEAQLNGLVDSEPAAGKLRDEGRIALRHAASAPRSEIDKHAPSAVLGVAQLEALEQATASVLSGEAKALVTGPTSKEAVTLAGQYFTGQTEHLAALAKIPRDEVTMLFLGPRLRTALVTTHMAVRAVPKAITKRRVLRTAVHLAEALTRYASATEESPALVWVAGLNPHAGEGGLFGSEDQDIIAPACAQLPSLEPFASAKALFAGMCPSEAAFRFVLDEPRAGVVAMMHDHATIACKLVDWGSSVNVTWGLPFVRTSVDHGVAYEAARDGHAECDGMYAALVAAERLSER